MNEEAPKQITPVDAMKIYIEKRNAFNQALKRNNRDYRDYDGPELDNEDVKMAREAYEQAAKAHSDALRVAHPERYTDNNESVEDAGEIFEKLEQIIDIFIDKADFSGNRQDEARLVGAKKLIEKLKTKL